MMALLPQITVSALQAILIALCAIDLPAQEQEAAADWKRALPGWAYEFPRDHFDHPDFKTEWWYFTGHLHEQGGKGRDFGFQVTFFRQGARAPGNRSKVSSRFVQDHFYFGHFAVSDLSAKQFYYTQEISRGAFDEAGAASDGGAGDRVVWLNDWNLTLNENDGFHTIALNKADGVILDMNVVPQKPLVFHGENGVSQKAAGAGNASHYYSCSRMRATGTMTIGEENISVAGEAWLDREWATNQLAADQVGWDWFSLQFKDGSELMIYQLRKNDGSADPVSSGTWIDPAGKSTHLSSDDFTLTPQKAGSWKSGNSGADYPLRWSIAVPSLGIDVTTSEVMQNQELYLPPLTYWEGAVKVSGTHEGQGYMELTGYGGTISPLSGSR
ncbi:MAG: lipocalin-like domain-containing protein [Verrucomicrobiales bacterium]